MNTFVTSDLHLGHGNIIKYSDRPFTSPNQMNEALIASWNMRVKPEDTIFHVGDFCFRTDKDTSIELGGTGKEKADYWLSRLNGNKIMIRGNHDNNNSLKSIIDSINITFANKRIKLVHIPEWADPTADINIVGHVHQKWHIRTFQEHYQCIAEANMIVPSDRKDWEAFLLKNASNSHSQSILFNCGVDVNNYMPVRLDEVIGAISKWKNTK